MLKAVVGSLFTIAIGVLGWALFHEPQPSVSEFLQRHWDYPLQAQGRPPENFSPLEASLSPDACGTCHRDQYIQWSSSLHSRTMGPGILWQLQLMNPQSSRDCLRCHAPLTEQFALLAQERGWSKLKLAAPDYVPVDLHGKGLVCAGCHVRRHKRFGPPPGPGALDGSAHNGFVAHEAFADSQFCANCHQFPENGPRLNGKLREDTFNQWRDTLYAKQGKTCQNCHMPDRKHQWKGIHDPQMTRAALTSRIRVEQRAGGASLVTATVTNSGAGHHFPTYVVPDVQLRLEYVSASGTVRQLARHTLAWRADLALSRELFDQRLPAGESVRLDAILEDFENTGSVRLQVRVSPAYQYLVTFNDYLQRHQGSMRADTEKLLRQAIQDAVDSQYDYTAAVFPLTQIAN